MGHHNGSAYYPGRILRSLWYTQGNKKEKDKVLSHLIEIAKTRQSQAKIVVTLRPNAVFFPFRAPLVPLKVVYRSSVTKPCTPTLRGQGDAKVSQTILTETVVYHQEFCTTIVFDFSWDDCNTQEKLE